VGFFSNITRYPRSPDHDPRENRLTECFATVLEEVDGLANRLLQAWGIATEAERHLHVRTQPMTQSGYFIDLEIRNGSQAFPECLTWIEVKHGSGLGVSQLERYSSDLASLPSDRRELVLLAPARFKVQRALPEATRRETWETVADVCRAVVPTVDDPVHRWLLNQFVVYLQEEGLSQLGLTADDIAVLPASMKAFTALDAVIERTAENMTDLWGSRLSPKTMGQTIDIEFTYAPHRTDQSKTPARTWRDSKFAWAFTNDDRQESPDVYGFGAYAWLGKERPELKPANRAWLASLTDEGFVYAHDGRMHGLRDG
jgi:hypothetical protein